MANASSSGPTAPPPPVWDSGLAGTGQVSYGGFWIRLVAYIIDAIVLTLVVGAAASMLGLSMFETDLKRYDPTINAVSFAIGWLYFALLESSERGATLGKMALGLRVVTNDGQRLTFLNATGRYFAKILSAIILGIGFIMIAFTGRKRGLHDILASTLVIKAR